MAKAVVSQISGASVNGKKTHRSRNAATPLTPAAAPRTPQKAQYDIVGPGASKKRRPARVEYHGETGRDSRQLPPMARLMAISLVRDACRNFFQRPRNHSADRPQCGWYRV